MSWFFIYLIAAIVSAIVGFGLTTGNIALVAKLAMLVFGGLAIVLLLAKPSHPHDDVTPR